MAILLGADSESPHPNLYTGHKIWGFYIAGDIGYRWTHADVAQFGVHGVEGALPIVVPPQDAEWWLENEGYATMETLVRDAVAWGLPSGSPIVIDIEEAQAERIGAGTCHAWAVAARAHGYVPWIYSDLSLLLKDQWCNKWLASWYGPAGTDHAAPTFMQARMVGWQYAGDVEGGAIDRDVFLDEHDYLTPDLKVRKIVSGEAAFGTPVPPSAPAAPAETPAPMETPVPEAPAPAAAPEPATEPEPVPAAEPPAPEPVPQEVAATVANDTPTADSAAKAALHAWVESFFA